MALESDNIIKENNIKDLEFQVLTLKKENDSLKYENNELRKNN